MPYSATIHWYRFARLYTLFLIVLAILLRRGGENWWPSSALVYVPPQFWLLPMVPLLFGLRRGGARFLLPLAASLAVWAFALGGLRLGLASRPPVEGARTLTVITNNVGESNKQSLLGFIEEQAPDLVVYQDYTSKQRQPIAFPGFQSRIVGRFALVSRYPITGAKMIPDLVWRRSLGAVFTIDWEGQPVHIYAVHIPTARTDYMYIWNSPRYTFKEKVRRYRESMQQRVAIGEKLAAIVAEDPLPAIVAGDFNMPPWGYLYQRVSTRLTDAFGTVGRGFGYTFPGHDPYLPTWFGAWLRIDYLFSNHGWTPIAATTEAKRLAQHRAVAATFEWKGKGTTPELSEPPKAAFSPTPSPKL